MSSNLTNCVITNTDAEILVDFYHDELLLLLDKHATKAETRRQVKKQHS